VGAITLTLGVIASNIKELKGLSEEILQIGEKGRG